MDVQFDGKRAIVTGAGKGIGRNIAKKLVECGAEVFALSRTQSDLDSLKSEVPNITTFQIELSDWDITRHVLKEIGPVDLLINNAAIVKVAAFLDTEKDDFDNVMEVNYNAVFNVSQVVAKAMIERGQGGSIVNISSIAAQKAIQTYGITSYSCSKAAIDMLTKCMALELGPHNIRVNAVSPGTVRTNMSRQALDDPAKSEEQNKYIQKYPLGKFLEIEDVVNTVLYLLSDKSTSSHGVVWRVDGGYCVH